MSPLPGLRQVHLPGVSNSSSPSSPSPSRQGIVLSWLIFVFRFCFFGLSLNNRLGGRGEGDNHYAKLKGVLCVCVLILIFF